jgi:hypothetical protein
MTTGRHADKTRGSVNWLIVAGAVSVITGICLFFGAADELLSNPPNGTPGPGTGFTLLAVSLCLVGVPSAAAAGLFAVRRIRQYRAWARGLTPEQRMMLHFAEVAAMEGAHLAMRDRNRATDARLSESVIGIERSGGDAENPS